MFRHVRCDLYLHPLTLQCVSLWRSQSGALEGISRKPGLLVHHRLHATMKIMSCSHRDICINQDLTLPSWVCRPLPPPPLLARCDPINDMHMPLKPTSHASCSIFGRKPSPEWACISVHVRPATQAVTFVRLHCGSHAPLPKT